MIGHYISRLTILVFGTLFPAYSSYKAIKNKDVKEYGRWMMYWIVFAIFSVIEVFADIFIGFWLPFYYEMKILFVLWLMSPYGNGSKILYLHLIHPQLTSHEETIDLYIESGKQLGITSVWHLSTKATEFGNKCLMTFLQILFQQIQRNGTSSIDGPRIQNEQLLSQPNFLQQFLFMRSPKPNVVQPIIISGQAVNSRPIIGTVGTLNPALNQYNRWFSEETLNITEVDEEFMPSSHRKNIRMRCESESNLDDWEQMDLNEIDVKPPLQPSKPKKKTKVKNSGISDKPMKRTARAAAIKARAKCRESFPEENDVL